MSDTPITMDEIRKRGFDKDVVAEQPDRDGYEEVSCQDYFEAGHIFSKQQKDAFDARERRKYAEWRKKHPPSPTETAIMRLFSMPNPEISKLITWPFPEIEAGTRVTIRLPKDAT